MIAVGALFLLFGIAQAGAGLGSPRGPGVGGLVLLGTDLLLAGSLVAVGVWLHWSPLGDEQALSVAKWGALGLTLPTVFVFLAFVFDLGLGGTSEQFATAFVAGGVIGSLYGSLRALCQEHDRVQRLYQRNRVLQRVLRHNIRNGMTVIQGYAQLLAQNGGEQELADKIDREARAIVDLADVARNLDAVGTGDETGVVDLSAVVRELLDTLGEHYPEASFETELSETAEVAADDSVEVAVWHLLEFGIHREPGSPVTVELTDGDRVTLSVADAGEDLSEDVIAALERGEETPLEHLDGMDLWVVKWLVESLDGEMTVTHNDPTGAEVRVSFDPAPAVAGAAA